MNFEDFKNMLVERGIECDNIEEWLEYGDDYEYATDGVLRIEQVGGEEGGGEYCYTVVKVDDIYYKVVYSYYSYSGTTFDYATVKVVTPQQKTITVYE